MYILINSDTMHVLAKHPNFQRLYEFGILSCSESCVVLPLERDELYNEFNDVQLQLLYINLTGNKEGVSQSKLIVSKILHYFLNKLPETIINEDVSHQADYAIANDKQGNCSYNKDGSIPNEELQNPLHVFTSNEIEQRIINSEATPTNMGQQGAWQPQREKSAPVARVAGDHRTASRTSGTRDIIFAVADQMWQDAGKPVDKSEILKLRREMMNRLELDGVKRNTSSNTLGVWVKERGLN